MFNSESNEAQKDMFTMTDEVRLAIADAGLEGDPAIQEMIKAGFVGPGGKEWDPIEFIEQRKALIESGEAGAKASEIGPDDMIQHSPAPETEHGSLSQL